MKRLAFCFDGTWNKLESKTPTNVAITAQSIDPLDGGTAQLIYYDEGVGTSFGEQFLGGVFGVGMVTNLAQAYRFLMFNYSPGDEIYVFGFSRGAYTARSFVGLLRNCGILRRRDAGRVSEAIKRYVSRKPEDDPHSEEMCRWRAESSPHICIDKTEDEWRVSQGGYTAGSSPIIRIRYLGVWDTVGSLGIPARYRFFDPTNSRHGFHDTRVTEFVESARHAVAIDERRRDFQPTLWPNFRELNTLAGVASDSELAPFQQKWFPGTHGSVGGGGSRRGLSDQALDWVLSGARRMGLKLDSTPASRIFDLNPSHTDEVENVPKKTIPSISDIAMGMFPADRNGPTELYELSMSARRRWLEKPESLPNGKAYRPGALSKVASALDALAPADVGLGTTYQGPFKLYEVQPDDTLSELARREYGNAKDWPSIYQANNHKIEDPNRIYPGWVLRIPDQPWVAPQP